MNILILNWRDPKHPLAGGAEVILHNYAKYWIKKGDKVTWFASSYSKAKKTDIVDGINVIRKGSHYSVFLWFFYYYIFKKFRDQELILDCFHFVPFFSTLFIKNKKIIAVIHEVADNVWFSNLPFPLAYLGFKLEPYFFRIYKNVPFITVSDSTKKELIKNSVPKSNIRLIPNGFNPPQLTKRIAKTKNPSCIFLGRISKDKGIEDALLAIELLARDFKEIKLYIAGKSEDKKYTKRIKSLVRQFKVQSNCEFFGYVDEVKKAELLSMAWILIHPSSKEGWGLNVIEANYLGTPAVGYDVPGLRDSILNEKTGLLVQNDAISLADGIEKLIIDRNKYRKMAAEAKKWTSKFDFEKSGKESYKLIHSI